MTPGPWTLPTAAFAASVLGLAVIWLGYPAAIWLCALGRRAPGEGAEEGGPPPRVSIVVAACNEAAHIVARLRNLAELDYPPECLQILVGEDGSTDGTAEQVRRWRREGALPRAQLLSSPRRLGKAAALNRAAAAAQGEILLFTDANNYFARDALRRLVAPFARPEVGAVTGRKSVAMRHGVGGGESVYWTYEGWLTRHESRCGGTVAGFGEALALRRELFTPLPTGVMVNDDLYLVLHVLAAKRRVVAVPARSFELAAADAAAEWERRNRMMVGRWQALASLRGRWRRLGAATGLKVLFHEVLRPISALWLGTALVFGLPLLAAPPGAVPAGWLALARLQALGWLWVAVVGLAHRAGARLGRAEAPFFFCLALGAALGGWWRYLRHSQPAAWRRAERARSPAPASPPGPPRGGLLDGLFWAGSSFLLGKLLVFGSVMVLARLLAPRAFGEVALAVSVITMLEIFGTLGLTSALIYEERDVDAAAQVCFTVTLATSLLAAALVLAAAPRLAAFFHDPGLAPILRVLWAVLPLTALGNTHDTLLRRHLAFRSKLVPDLGMAAVKGAVAVALAWRGWGVWSLVWGQVFGAAVATLLLWRISPWRPRHAWNRAVARRLRAYSQHIYFLDASSVVLTNLDSFTIGRMLSATLLGFYTLAFRVPEVALLSVLNVVTRVVFPALSRLQADAASLRRTLLEVTRYTTLVTLPLAAGLIVLASPLVTGFYGARWAAAAAPLRVLALCGGVRCLVHHFGDAYKASGRPDVLTRVTAAWWLLLPPSLVIGARYGGLVGVAWGEVATRVVMNVLHLFLIGRILDVRPAQVLRCWAPAVETTLVMCVVLEWTLPRADHLAPRMACLAMASLGGAVYMGWLRLRYPQVVSGAWRRARRLPGLAPRADAGAVPAVAES